jgi:hypothetical protein
MPWFGVTIHTGSKGIGNKQEYRDRLDFPNMIVQTKGMLVQVELDGQ